VLIWNTQVIVREQILKTCQSNIFSCTLISPSMSWTIEYIELLKAVVNGPSEVIWLLDT